MARIVRLLLIAFAATALLGGCATGYLLDNRVQSFTTAGAAATPPFSYRFDRLPSQLAEPSQATLEAYADPALHKAGLQRDDAAPRYSVQVSARIQRTLSPWADPWQPWGWGFGIGGRGWGFHRPFPYMEQPWFQREVSVVVRELPANRVVFESHAANDGPWLDNRSVLPAMFEAALQGFPNPPTGPRRVDIQVGAAAR
ncbi:DUF4136 domain-containing protein [Caenimonas sedimenti]|uniref:DUF4136 domain-containing protein n=1 Tax=Caenimonas sedimenti TaxID=2596921 RepID=A0A562ZEN2_9BURK|nr:DUF4136 domain-containing protein [Caenimonas sedimenti]TWO64994.1 DUF4136 domain-containing protein [Caenimonas sedimenti]